MTRSEQIYGYVRANRVLAEELIKRLTAKELVELCTAKKMNTAQMSYVLRKKSSGDND